MEEDFDKVLVLTIVFRGEESAQLINFKEGLNVDALKRELKGIFDIEVVDLWLVYRGRKLSNYELVSDLDVKEFDKVFMGIETRKSPPLPSNTNTNATTTASQVKRRNNESGMDSFISTIMANNPELLLQILQSNPKMKSMMDKNPQLKHALSDPKTLKELLTASTNKTLQAEMMRGHDRALSNIENLPGGFRMLENFYKTEMEDLEEALDSVQVTRKRSASLDMYNCNKGNEKAKYVADPMPNPWSSKKSPTYDSELGSFLSPKNYTESPTSDTESSTSSFDVMVYEQRFHRELDTMEQMGFTDTKENIRALLATGGNVSLAIERIINKL